MARQEATNIFSDGLMSDLHPINTPKSVLTDCLNGTYITYNGNEFILQNDMGNYKLKNCRLPVNFIPVGVKSYADILYIVSYNPITKEVEIGSYPAPQSIFTTGDSDSLLAPEDDLAPFIINEKEVEYPEIIRTNKKPIFVFSGGTEEDTYKLNPGDEFKFTEDPVVPEFVYQHLNFYVIDEDNKLYDIDDTDLYITSESGGLTLVTEDLRKVFWETPGWLAAQYNLYVPDKFNLNLRSLNVPEFLLSNTREIQQIDVSIDLNAQVIISDPLFIAELNKPKISNDQFRDLYIRFIRSSNEQSSYAPLDFNCIKYNYQDDIVTAYVNVSSSDISWTLNVDTENNTSFVEISAYPIIKYNDKVLKYTQFETTYRFNLNDLKNPSDIKIAENIYKWAVDEDSCTFSFDVQGPFINVGNIVGGYRINQYKYNGDNTWSEEPVKFEENIELYEIPNLVLFGQNILNITFGNTFIKEGGIYSIEIVIAESMDAFKEKHFIRTKKMVLIPSEVFNDYFGSIDNYSALTMSDWVGKIVNFLQLETYNIANEITPNINEDKSDLLYLYYNAEPHSVKLDSRENFTDSITIEDEEKANYTKNLTLEANLDYFSTSLNLTNAIQITSSKICAQPLWTANYERSYKLGELDIDKDGNIKNAEAVKVLSEVVDFSVTSQTGYEKLEDKGTSLFDGNTDGTFHCKLATKGPGQRRNFDVKYNWDTTPEEEVHVETASERRATDSPVFTALTEKSEHVVSILDANGAVEGSLYKLSLALGPYVAGSTASNIDVGNSIYNGTNAGPINLDNCILFRTSNVSPRGKVLVNFGTTTRTIVLNDLKNVTIQRYATSPTTIYTDTATGHFNNLLEEYIVNVSSMIGIVKIKELKYNEYTYFDGSALFSFDIANNGLYGYNLINGSGSLNELKAEIFTPVSNNIVFKLTDNSRYETILTNINNYIDYYNTQVTSINMGDTGGTVIDVSKVKSSALQAVFKTNLVINGQNNFSWKVSNTNRFIWGFAQQYNENKITQTGDPTGVICICYYDSAG